jgi:hypothetical protein
MQVPSVCPVECRSPRLGHKDQTTTLRIYSHALPKDDNRAAETWDAITADIRGAIENIEALDSLGPVQ